jgi:hypothetical protein
MLEAPEQKWRAAPLVEVRSWRPQMDRRIIAGGQEAKVPAWTSTRDGTSLEFQKVIL